jgi:hypothetical protein
MIDIIRLKRHLIMKKTMKQLYLCLLSVVTEFSVNVFMQIAMKKKRGEEKEER